MTEAQIPELFNIYAAFPGVKRNISFFEHVLGTKEKILIDILTGRSNAQRQLICKAYQEATGRVRCHSSGELSAGNFLYSFGVMTL